jgi:AmpE protein
MSLLSLLIALAAEKSLSSSLWRFDYYYKKYANFFKQNFLLSKLKGDTFSYTIFLFVPVAVLYGILFWVGEGGIHFIISTVVLIVCFGCSTTRNSYKHYLQAAFRGEPTTSDLFHQQLLVDKNLPPIGFGQALIWLNYRYYIAIMLFFTIFGAVGVLFYRLLTAVIEQQNLCTLDQSEHSSANDKPDNITEKKHLEDSSLDVDSQSSASTVSSGCRNYHAILFYVDWLPVRITSFGYMFVGHFSKALPVWLASFFDGKKATHQILIDVAQKSEDDMVDKDDCTAEPCLLVRLSKRNVLLLLATIATFTLFGVIS